MANIYDVDASELIEKVSEELKKNENIKAPDWAMYAKTGRHKERVPIKNDWWYTRTAAVLRTVYKYGPIGVSKLRVKYGGKKRRGHKPSRFYPGSGNIIRKALQQLEKAGFLKTDSKSKYKGRILTSEGKSFLDKISTQIYKGSNVQPKKIEKPVEQPKKVEKPKEVKKEPVKKEEDGKVQTSKSEAKTSQKA
ncbi:30S ribosomal protein S19e [Candidatus Woesearchaeota archaeon B3_Woes]|nr:MAG: 30S ribosomal protein S19e [Candidatus Woesearchaeota archaeon B3_Woes]